MKKRKSVIAVNKELRNAQVRSKICSLSRFAPVLAVCALMACSVPTLAANINIPPSLESTGEVSTLTGFAVDLTQTTLDSLAGQPIPNTDPVEYFPTDLKSGYELIPTDTVGANTITKYIINDDNTLTPQYFNLNLHTTEYGEGDSVKYYVWTLDETTGHYTFSETTADAAQITLNYDSSSILSSMTSFSGEEITGNFIGNNYVPDDFSAEGGAIFNSWGTIGNITGNFIGDYTASAWYDAKGGAIFNCLGTIGNITGGFIGNSVTTSSVAEGGAIFNCWGTIGDIVGDFIGNRATTSGADTRGGAIFNNGTIGDVTGSFIGNYASSTSLAEGGAIFNNGAIGGITADFIGNYLTSTAITEGGAIYNNMGYVSKIAGDFIRNYATTSGAEAKGGAIFNYWSTIDNITANFVENSLFSTYVAEGGAIFNCLSTIGGITGDFIGNIAETTGLEAKGGAIFNNATIGDITGSYIGNYATSTSLAEGGAIFNCWGTIGKITANFIENYTTTTGNEARGGAVFNNGKIGDITGNFIGNAATSTSYAVGGAIFNCDGIIGNITSLFKGNYVSVEGVTSAEAYGGAVYNRNTPVDLLSEKYIDFDSYDVIDDSGNSVLMVYRVTDGSSLSKYITRLNDGVNLIPQVNQEVSSTLDEMYSTFCVDNIDDLKAALIADGYFLETPQDLYAEHYLSSGNVVIDALNTIDALTFKNSSFIGNHADVTEGGIAAGGAIYSTGHIRMIADNGQTSLISGNYTKIGEVINDTAITMGNGGILVLDIRNNSTIQIDDKVEFESAPEGENLVDGNELTDESSFVILNNKNIFALIGDKTGKTVINNDIINTDEIFMEQANVFLGRDDVFNQSNSIALGNGFLSMANGAVGQIHLPKVGFFGETNVAVDVDLATETMDRITGDEYVVIDGAEINVTELNLLSDATKDSVKILFADEEFAPIVDYTGENPVVYSPIYKYNIGYEVDNDDNKGYFLFDRYGVPTGGNGGNGGPSIAPSNPSQIYNPSVLATPAAQQSGGQAVMTETVRFAFQHADTFSQLPMNVRMSMMNNRYAVLDGEAKYQKPYHMQNKGVWVKPFTSFESMSLKNGPKVDAVTYGTLIGFDSDFKDLGKGWYGVTSAYAGYNGSMIEYANVDTTMNGGIVGLTETLYKGKFFSALTATAGASAGSSNTMYGHENFAMLLGGIGSKTGYNFEFQEGKYIIQPVMFLNYTFVNTFDYTNAAGVNMESDPMHSLQLNPSVRFIANFKNGWQPYASVGMVWNVLNSSKVRANDILLPRMSVKPYVEYGLGLQRSWADRFTAYGQAMVRNGGRNGVMLSAGMRWSLGEDEPIDAI